MSISIVTPTRDIKFDDGHGRQTHVRTASGKNFLVSEVHRALVIGRRIDETLVFPCDTNGQVTDYSEVFSGYSTEDVLANFRG